MTQAVVTPYIKYTADGVLTTFAYPWRIGTAADLEVLLDAVVVSSYTVTGVNQPNGGNIVFIVPPNVATDITIRRVTPQTQDTDYIVNDAFGAETHEAALDKLTRMVQDLGERFSRIPILPVTTAQALRNLTLPGPVAGQVLGWNNDGTALTLYEIPGGLTPPAQIVGPLPSDILLSDFAVGDGTTDDSAAFQAAANQAILERRRLFIDPVAVGYRLNTPINLTDVNGFLTIAGAGMQAPITGLAIGGPQGGSVLLGNTGVGMPILDLCGSNNIMLRDFTLSTFGQPTPSHIGILMGGSTTSPIPQYPAGGNLSLENMAIYMTTMVSVVSGSIPLYAPNAGLHHFYNVNTLGDYGLYFTSNNELGLSSPFVEFVGNTFINAGVTLSSCNLYGHGTQAILQIEGATSFTVDKLYTVTIVNGPSYTGQIYSIRLKDCVDIWISVENDYWPAVLFAEGALTNVHLRGIHFPGTTPLPADIGVLGAFFTTKIIHSSFKIYPLMGTQLNYLYTMPSVSPTLDFMYDCDFLVSSFAGANFAFFNAKTGHAKPFFNLRFDGDSASDFGPVGAYVFLVDGVDPGTGAYRVFVNGEKEGTG